jgi:hypothetical protein
MQPDDFTNAPADAIAYYGAAERAFDAKAEAALRKLVRFRKNGEVGIGTALPMTVNRVKIGLARQLDFCSSRLLRRARF